MPTADTIRKLVWHATPSHANIPPNERKPEEKIRASRNKLESDIAQNPKQVFLTMAEHGISGLDFFTLDQLKSLGPVAIQVFTTALTDPGHPWFSYAKVIYAYAQIDNSPAALDTIMQRLTAEIEERGGFAYRFFPMAGYALKLFDVKEVSQKIIPVLKYTSWNNRYFIAMSLRNLCRSNPNRALFQDAFSLLLEMVAVKDLESPTSEKILKCQQQVNFALDGI